MAGKLLKFVRDTGVPTISVCTMASNNTLSSLFAKIGDIITLSITASERIKAPVVTIDSLPAQVTRTVGDTGYTAIITAVTGNTQAALDFTVDFTDIVGNSGTQVTAVTSGSKVTFDKTAPTLSSILKDSVTQITVTLSELANAASITKSNTGGFVVYETGTPATTYSVSAIAPGATDDLVVLTIADMTASAIPGVTVTYATGGNGTVCDRAGNVLATNATGIATGAF